MFDSLCLMYCIIEWATWRGYPRSHYSTSSRVYDASRMKKITACNGVAAGSSPVADVNQCSSVGRAPKLFFNYMFASLSECSVEASALRLGRRDRKFESYHSDQVIKETSRITIGYLPYCCNNPIVTYMFVSFILPM